MRDEIRIKNFEELDYMQKWVNQHVKNPSVSLIALQSYRLFIEDYGWALNFDYDFKAGSFHVSAGGFSYDCAVTDTPTGGIHFDVANLQVDSLQRKQWLEEKAIAVSRETGEKQPRMHSFVFVNCILQNYIVYHGMDALFDVEEKEAHQRVHKAQKGKKRKPTVRLYKCYTLKKDWESAPRLKQPIKYTCPAWGVRGHIRHLKNGKEVYVRPCVKGKDRNKYVGKEYKLLKQEETA